jgi:hypothetical protein
MIAQTTSSCDRLNRDGSGKLILTSMAGRNDEIYQKDPRTRMNKTRLALHGHERKATNEDEKGKADRRHEEPVNLEKLE